MTLKKTSLILAIETSCDETAAAILEIKETNPGTRTFGSVRGSNSSQSSKSANIIKASHFPEILTLSSVVRSQIKLHSKMGGVVPEVAARAHIKNILPVVQKALSDASRTLFDGRQKVSFSFSAILNKIDYLAVTVGPGLIPSLIVGVEFTKGLSFATGKPIIPVNHLEGHLYSPFHRNEGNPRLPRVTLASMFPQISLIVSGGHTILTLMKNEKQYCVLGQTLDDAAGEAFDKIAKLLKLAYPGGPEIAKLAKRGRAIIDFPRPMIHHKNYNFSFAGLKTSVLYYLRDHRTQVPPLPSLPHQGGGIKGGGLKTAALYYLRSITPSPPLKIRGGRGEIWKADICASFQQAVVDVLVAKTLRAAKEFKAKSISLSGGVSANWLLRRTMQNECKKNHLLFFAPPAHLCTDNAEMIGIAAAFKLSNGFKPQNYKTIKPNSNLEL